MTVGGAGGEFESHSLLRRPPNTKVRRNKVAAVHSVLVWIVGDKRKGGVVTASKGEEKK